MQSSGETSEQRATALACAKINLVLDLLGPRDDGYTEIATIFQTVGLADEIDVSVGPAAGGVSLAVEGDEPCPETENLAYRAAAAHRSLSGSGEAVRVRLTKKIPAGAGLGGGSSDAAAVLRCLERIARPRLGEAAVLDIARRLGADVPYFLHGGLALGTGRGDRIELLEELPRRWVVLARSGGPLSTARVYAASRRALTPRTDPLNILRFQSQLREDRGGPLPLANGLQAAAVSLRPELEHLLDRLVASGGQALLSGSGSAVFGLFVEEGAAREAAARVTADAPGVWVSVSATMTRADIVAREAGRTRR
jgi:4-diphosphocytidyl-2-C-methyl-D-erythritol kinase